MLEVFYAQEKQLVIDRVIGRNGHRINYRHVIWSLIQKPGAFARYRYREDLFPTLAFRKTYDAIAGDGPSTAKDLVYLRILHLAAATMQTDVEAGLTMMLEAKKIPDVESLKELVGTPRRAERVPPMAALEVDLSTYDELLAAGGKS